MNNPSGVEIADIVAPAIPPDATTWHFITVVAGLITVLIFASVALYRIRSRRSTARRRLARVQRALARERIEPRMALYSTASALRHAFGLTRLTASTPLPFACRRRDLHSQRRWRTFAAALAAQRYGPANPDRDMALDMVREARCWLWPWR